LVGVAAIALLASGALSRSIPTRPAKSIGAVLPAGAAIIGASKFATIRVAPPSPTGDVKSERQNYRTVSEWYAHENRLTLAEAKKRLSEQQGLQSVFERLQERLRRDEPDNYVDARLVHQPDWAYILHFKRDPDATLRRYTINPRFKAAHSAYTTAELQAIIAPWAKRFADENIGGGYGLSPTEGRVEMMMSVTAAEYRAVALRKGWGAVPAPIRMGFAVEPAAPRVDPRIAHLLRGFASESRATGIQMEAGFTGQVILDDGCLRLRTKDGSKGPLVVFHKESGIGLDAQGYLAAIDRATGKATGRIGEMWSWGGPNPGTMFDGLQELKRVCGDGPIVNVGNPESRARFKARYAKTR